MASTHPVLAAATADNVLRPDQDTHIGAMDLHKGVSRGGFVAVAPGPSCGNSSKQRHSHNHQQLVSVLLCVLTKRAAFLHAFFTDTPSMRCLTGARPYLSLTEAGHVPPADASDPAAGGYERQVSGFATGSTLSPATTSAPLTARSIQGGQDFRRCAQ